MEIVFEIVILGIFTFVAFYYGLHLATRSIKHSHKSLVRGVLYGFIVLLVYKYFMEPVRASLVLAQMFGVYGALRMFDR